MGYVYLICDPNNDTYKIGVTRGSNYNRVKKLQTGNSTELHIIHSYECEYPFRLEKMLHAYYINKKELNEWFRLDQNDVINFKSLCDDLNKKIYSLLDNPFFAKNIR